MAELGVFASGGAGDLLQQAFQQVVDDDDAELVTFLHSGDDQPLIQISAEQAAALGITFDDQPPNQQTTLTLEDSQRIIDQLTSSGILKQPQSAGLEACNGQNGHSESYQYESMDSNINSETTDNGNQNQQNIVLDQTSNFIQLQQSENDSITTEQEVPESIESQGNGNILQNTIQFSIAPTVQGNSISESQAQILQRYPVILPSSQFIIKPAQTVLTPVKNIRILPQTSKVSSIVQTSQNSLLLPKTQLLNNIPPQIIKAMPVGTQFISATNNISTQLLNTSQMFAKTCDSSNNNQIISNSISTSTFNNVPTFTQSLIRQSSVQKPSQAQNQQKGNLQQFFTPLLKTSNTVLKNNSLLNNKQNVSSSLIKHPTQALKTAYVKSPVVSTTLSKNKSTPVIFRTNPVTKSDDFKSTSPSTPLFRTQVCNSPVSILKPQPKTVNSLIKHNISSKPLPQKSSLTKPIELSESIKPLASAKLKQSMNSIIKNIKKKTISIPQKPTSINKDSAHINKPLGSSENPIQIVQQGHTFHSMQRLTQPQLDQIAQILHQRSQESSNPNEKVVYRLVFPDELDTKIKSPSSLLKNRAGKRGRPKKGSAKAPGAHSKSSPEDDFEDSKDDHKKIVARTRSGRLSRPPRHMVRDYKHLHHIDSSQPELDDSDGGYSDYNMNGIVSKLDEDEQADSVRGPKTELLAGLEVPKRKISDHFKCPTCNKIYLGRTRMAKHFEMHPDHGSPDQLPPPTVEPETKPITPQDPLKRKGKKRGPWAYTTPEAKSERRQLKLQEAISVCEGSEIAKIAGKPVANSLSLFELLQLKSGDNMHTFLAEVKELIERVRDKTCSMLTMASNDDKLNCEVVNLNEELLCDVLGLNSGFYKVNEPVCPVEPELDEGLNPSANFEREGTNEPLLKKQKTEPGLGEVKENFEERLSSGFSEASDLSVSDFLNERRSESVNSPEILSTLTLVPRNSSVSPVNDEVPTTTVSSISEALSSGAEVQTTDNTGFQKLNLSVSTQANSSFLKEGEFTKLGDSLDSSCSDVFKLNGSFDQEKNLPRTFIKLEPTEEGFIKLENGMLQGFDEIEDFGKIQSNGFLYISNGTSDTFNSSKGFRKLVPTTSPSPTNTITTTVPNGVDLKVENNINKNLVQITTNSTSNSDNTDIFESSDNMDITKMTSYDHITHLDILNNSSVIDKNLMLDEKLVEPCMHLVDNSNIVDELVSERLKSIMSENLLDSNLLHSNGGLNTDLDFDEFSEEFNRNIRS